jgi:hypothetical protein
MAERTFLSVGYNIPGYSNVFLAFDSDRSLLDADIIVFQPEFTVFPPYQESYRGKVSLDDATSARVSEHCKRWRYELAEALKAGKTVFVFLPPLEGVYVHHGQKQYSGTGRNQKVTRIVEPLSNYDALPFDLGTIIPKNGTQIRVASDLKQLAPYWKQYGADSPYNVYFTGPKGTAILTATSSDAVVGLIIKNGKGTAVLVPPIEYDEDKLQNAKGTAWNKEGIKFGERLIGMLVETDRALRAEAEVTPAPEWAAESEYRLSTELTLETQLQGDVGRDREIARTACATRDKD